MEDSPRFWLTVRIVLAALSVPVWLLIRAAMPDDFSLPPKWYFPLVSIAFSFFSVLAWSITRPDQHWSRPSWSSNPLDRAAPLEGMHLAAWSFLLGSAGLLVAGMLQLFPDWAWVLPGSIGAGLLAGVYTVSARRPSNGP